MKTVIFDFDGTLADSYEMFEELIQKFAPLFTDVPISKDEVGLLRQMPIQKVLQKYKISPIKIWKYRKLVMEEVKQRVEKMQVFPGIKEMLSKLKRADVRLFILTSNDKENVDKFLMINGISEFEGVYSEKNLFGKAAVLSKMVKEYKLNLDEPTFYVGDEVRDIEAAHKAKMKVIAVTWGYNKQEILEKYNPEAIVTKPEEILDILI